MNLGQQIFRLRQERRMSQEQVAEHIGVSRQSVAKWESGQALPDLENLIKLRTALGVSFETLLIGPNQCGSEPAGAVPENLPPGIPEFLCRAKRSTYAGRGNFSSSCRPFSHDLEYEEDDYRYYDSYFGGPRFLGEEILWISGRPYWGMNYYGCVLDARFSGDFLKDALLEVAPELPYRGPELFRRGDYTYQCSVHGDFFNFRGVEYIYCDEVKTFECRFHGGTVLE